MTPIEIAQAYIRAVQTGDSAECWTRPWLPTSFGISPVGTASGEHRGPAAVGASSAG